MHIRGARPDELASLQDIERAAGTLFLEISMPEIAEDAPLTMSVLGKYQSTGHALVAVGASDRPVGYLLCEPNAEFWHVEQLSVHPDHAGNRIGHQLLDHLATTAREAGAAALTLTTFSQVPWNAPYYRRLGFETMNDHELPARLREIRAAEIAAGYDRWPRECMWRKL